MSDDTGNGWGEYRKLVMTEIDRLAREIRHERNNAKQVQQHLWDQMLRVEKEVATLKVRCGVWGMVGGLIPVVTALMMSRIPI
jgi:hypothetical protein